MNERNVAALQKIMDAGGWGWPDERRKCAEYLAERGVLVPSTLTSEDFTAIYEAFQRVSGTHERCLAALDRIAKGESHTADHWRRERAKGISGGEPDA